MAAYFHALGAIEHYVVPRNSTALYLGTAVTAPEIEIRPAYLNVINDIGGRSLPMQKVGDREQHMVTTTLNRFDYAAYKRITNGIAGGTQSIGSHTPLTQGTLTIQNLDFELVLVYAAVAAGITATGLPVARRYYSAQVIGARESTVGTRVEEVTLMIECNEIFDATTRNFHLYTEGGGAVTGDLPPAT